MQRMLTDDQKRTRLNISRYLLSRYMKLIKQGALAIRRIFSLADMITKP